MIMYTIYGSDQPYAAVVFISFLQLPLEWIRLLTEWRAAFLNVTARIPSSTECNSRDVSAIVVTSYVLNAVSSILLFAPTFRPIVGSTQPSIQREPGTLVPRGMRPGREADLHSKLMQRTRKRGSTGIHISTLPNAFTACSLGQLVYSLTLLQKCQRRSRADMPHSCGNLNNHTVIRSPEPARGWHLRGGAATQEVR